MRAWDLTADEIELWAASPDAKGVLPALIHRLLLASAPVVRIDFPSGSSVYRGGFDGELEAESAGLYWPEGTSVWELSTEKKPLAKIMGDLEKRRKIESSTGRHYVAVSAVRINRAARAKWVASNDASPFATLRIIDADDLAQWLSVAGAVSTWFRERALGASGAVDLVSLDRALDDWSHETAPPLPSSFLLLGRERAEAAVQLRAWAQAGVVGPLTLTHNEPHEAAMFAASALALDPVHAETWKARAIVVRSADGFRVLDTMLAARENVLPILDYQHTDPLRQDRRIILTRRERTGEQHLELPEIVWGVLQEALVSNVGMPPHEAEVLARDSRGSLHALRSRLNATVVPPWVDALLPDVLTTLLLLGGARVDLDYRAAGSALLGRDANELIQAAEQLHSASASPLVAERTYRGERYVFTSHEQAWALLSKRLSTSVMERLSEVAPKVLSCAEAQGLHHAVALSVARMGSMNQRRAAAASIVRVTLDDAPADRWAVLDRTLPLVAEAAPTTFLEAARVGLRTDGGLTRLVSRLHRPLTGLIWALERLAWDESNLPAVLDVLRQLAAIEQPGNVSPNAMSTLCALLDIRVPQTNASDEVIEAGIKQLVDAAPDLAFRALARNLHDRGMYMEQHPPEVLRTVVEDFRTRATKRGPGAKGRYLVVRRSIIDLAGASAARWKDLVEHFRHDEAFITALEGRVSTIDDSGGLLWDALRTLLHDDAWHALGVSHVRLLDADARARIRKLYELLTPSNRDARIRWLFRFDAKLPDITDADWRAEQRQVDGARLAALTLLRDERGDDGLLSFLESLDQLLVAHNALVQSSFLSDLLVRLESPPERLSELYGSLLARENVNEPAAVLKRTTSRNKNVALQIALRLPHTTATWDAIDAAGPDLASDYWRSLAVLFDADRANDERAVGAMLAVGNVRTAFRTVTYHPERVSDELAVRVVTAALHNAEPWLRESSIDLTYWLPRIFDRWRASGAIDAKELAVLAARAFDIDDGFDDFGGLPWLTPLFEADADLFARLILHAHGRDVSLSPLPDLSRERSAAMLHAWRGMPFDSRADELLSWTLSVFLRASASLSPRAVITHLANLLVFAPPRDSHWPAETTRRLIEGRADGSAWNEEMGDDFAGALQVAKFNARGVHSRALGDGGRQERVLSAQYVHSARALRAEWPRTARMLERMSSDYGEDADLEDARTRSLARAEGFEVVSVTPLDMLVAIVLSTVSYESLDDSVAARVANIVDVSVAELSASLHALERSRFLYGDGSRRLNRSVLLQYLLQGPFEVGKREHQVSTGIATATSHAWFRERLVESGEPFVMAVEDGDVRGAVLPPFEPRAPRVASKSAHVLDIVAAVDVLRLPSLVARARELAIERLKELL